MRHATLLATICVLFLVPFAAQAAEPAATAAPDLSPQITEGVVHATPAELWKVWSTPEGHRKLGVSRCAMDFRVGGLIRTAYDSTVDLAGEGAIQNEILAYEPERVIAFRIHRPAKGFPFPGSWQKTWWVATMTDLHDGTTNLRIAGMGYDATPESQKMREFFRVGNAYTLSVLQAAFDPDAASPGGTGHGDRR